MGRRLRLSATTPVTRPTSLDYHSVGEVVTEHALDLLRNKPQSASHILIYGPPGTGKTSYAYGLGNELGLEIHAVDHGGKNDLSMRQAAISECVNMARGSNNVLVIADDCDTILRTRDAWQLWGVQVDRKWLHDILESPGVRMVWIVNSAAGLEESVIRRFSFSIRFRLLNRSQRIQLWERVLNKYKIRRYFDD